MRSHSLPLVAVAVATMLGTAGAAAPLPGDGPRPAAVNVLPPPDGPWPEGGEFTVFLCEDDSVFASCHKRATTGKQKRALRARLKAMPGVATVRFESRREAWELFRRVNADNETLLSAIRVEDMPESFGGTLRRRADIMPFKSAFQRKPQAGTSNVVVRGRDFWEDKADLRIDLCGPVGDTEACEGRGPATPEERRMIEAEAAGARGVERLYLEDAEHAARVTSFALTGFLRPGRRLDPAGFSEQYYVKLTDPRGAEALAETIGKLPGVLKAEPTDNG
ncbi:permease-like cell division protein FtsX [Streptosporangium sp. NPDC004379]|uniref:permease-like cell division protein FtsX n=1 Tax=Streptosporangium sp. NPDC004379 TaxID=3366189 RepID=UPI0036AAA7CC